MTGKEAALSPVPPRLRASIESVQLLLLGQNGGGQDKYRVSNPGVVKRRSIFGLNL